MQQRKIILTGAALLCRCLSFYPVWLLLLALHRTGGFLPSIGVLLAVVLLPAGCTRICKEHFRSGSSAGRAIAGTVLLLSGAAGVYLVRQLSGSLFTGLVTVFPALLVTQRKLEAEPDELFQINAYAAMLSGCVIVTAMLAIADLPYHISLTAGVIGLISAVYFLLRNQFMLLRFVNRRSTGEADVPQDIRRSNLGLVCGVIILLAVIWLCRVPMLHLLQWMQEAARQLAIWLLEGITRLFAWLGGKAPEQAMEEAGEMPGEMRYGGKSSPLWLLLWVPVIWVAWYMWRTLLSDWGYDLRLWMTRLLRRFRRQEDAETLRLRQEQAEYYDTETLLAPARSAKQRRRNWKKELRSWQKTADSAEKYYQGYGLLLRAPCWAEEELRGSDTAQEIREKWMQAHLPRELLDAVTDAFHADRYAEQGLPPGALSALAHALSTVADSKSASA